MTQHGKHAAVAFGRLTEVELEEDRPHVAFDRLGAEEQRAADTIGELAEPFGLTLNGVKKHVGILETVDLVITEKVSRARECRLGPAQLEDATDWIDDYRRVWERRLDRFGAYVEERE